MNSNDKINENQEMITENSDEKYLKNQVNSFDLPLEDKDKIETKGLKLKKSTKERLNLLQSSFDDAESMIVALLNQYEVFKVENNEKFSDRKAEIDRFNFLIDSLKNCFVNSLEMAIYIEDKFAEKMKNEIKKKDKAIIILQEENNSLKNKIKNVDLEIDKKSQELAEVKDSFSRVNLALTTVEKELTEKSSIIQNLQLHIKSLTEMSDNNKEVKIENEQLKERIKVLEDQLSKINVENQNIAFLKRENERYIAEISNLQIEKNEYKDYSNKLNIKIQEILIEKANEISKINMEKNNMLKELENEKNEEIKKNNNLISRLKDELFELKLKIGKSI